MARPEVKITFENGVLGQVASSDDGIIGMLAIGANEVDYDAGGFTPGVPYMVKNFAAFEKLGVTAENNPNLYRNVKAHYAEAGDGTELWIMGFSDEETFLSVLDKDNNAGAKALLLAANGKINGLVAFKTPAASYTLAIDRGLDIDVYEALPLAQSLGEWMTETRYAPIFTLIEGYGYAGSVTELADLTEMGYNRVGVVIGDTAADSKNACMGVVSGRVAASAVQRKISRVRDGALQPLEIYIGGELAESADVETINGKGFITFGTFVGKSGYYIVDDHMATEAGDDYNSLTNRRVIDKAYRVAYTAFLNYVNDEIPVSKSGNLSPAWCAACEADIEAAIVSQMTNNGNLGNDPADSTDTGVKCNVPYEQDIYATSQLGATLRVKPNGYAKYINVSLGFKTA